MPNFQGPVPVKRNFSLEAMKEFLYGNFRLSRPDESGTFARSDASRSARRIAGGKALADKLEVGVPEPEPGMRSDDNIRRECEHALEMTVPGENHAIKVMVSSGWVRLSGTVNQGCERWAAEEIVSRVIGVNGINGQIEVQH